MAAASLMAPDGPTPGRRRKRSPFTFGRIVTVVGVGLVAAIAYNMLSWESVSDRPNEMKTTQVILPPPPPPPPPEPKPVEQPPEPKMAEPLDQPLDTPPPPQQSSDPTPGDSALTAREGAGPSNYGLAVGDGGGTRIGGRPGGGNGDAFRAYAGVAQRCVQRALQSDSELSRVRYTMQVAVSFDPEGRITSVRSIRGDDKRDARVRDVLTGLQCSPPPPAGLPVVRLDLNARAGG